MASAILAADLDVHIKLLYANQTPEVTLAPNPNPNPNPKTPEVTPAPAPTLTLTPTLTLP